MSSHTEGGGPIKSDSIHIKKSDLRKKIYTPFGVSAFAGIVLGVVISCAMICPCDDTVPVGCEPVDLVRVNISDVQADVLNYRKKNKGFYGINLSQHMIESIVTLYNQDLIKTKGIRVIYALQEKEPMRNAYGLLHPLNKDFRGWSIKHDHAYKINLAKLDGMDPCPQACYWESDDDPYIPEEMEGLDGGG